MMSQPAPHLADARMALRKSIRGASLIEVLVTIVVIAFGLLGMAGLQTRLQLAEMESYQRAQALLLLNDIHDRIKLNFAAADNYVTGAGTPLGVGGNCPTGTSTRQQRDAAEWCNALQGAAESAGGGNVGAMVGARGCVESLGNSEYLVTVAWQGLSPISAPSAACGQNLYNGGATCTQDRCRRVVTTKVSMRQ